MNIKDRRELRTILAALHLYRNESRARSVGRINRFVEAREVIACNEGRMVPMTDEELDALYRRIEKAAK